MLNLSFLLLFLTLIAFPASAQESSYPINERPMYGEVDKNEEERAADQQLFDSIEQAGISFKDASASAAKNGFIALEQAHDTTTAIKRFNQAWLLDPENGNAYFGFAMIAAWRDHNAAEADKFYKIALQKGNVDNGAIMNYCQFLFSENRYGESIPYLEKLLKMTPAASAIRPMLAFAYKYENDIPKACQYAHDTIENNEKLSEGNLYDYCTKQ